MQVRLWLLLSAAAISGCASGPKYSDIKGSIPAVDPAAGRIYFYRSSAVGAAVQPDIRLNGEVVGEMKPLGFFYVDRSPGRYFVSAQTEAEATLHVNLEANQTQYVRGSITFGFFVGHPDFTLVDRANAVVELDSLSYTGTAPLVPGSAGTEPPAASAGSTTAEAAPPAASGTTSMKDLEGLLPGKEKAK